MIFGIERFLLSFECCAFIGWTSAQASFHLGVLPLKHRPVETKHNAEQQLKFSVNKNSTILHKLKSKNHQNKGKFERKKN